MTTPTTAPEASEAANDASMAPKLPLTISEAATLWGCSKTTVKRLIAQNRVKADRRGGGAVRGGTTLIWQLEKPERLAPGSLTEDQRKAWNKGKKVEKKPKAEKKS